MKLWFSLIVSLLLPALPVYAAPALALEATTLPSGAASRSGWQPMAGSLPVKITQQRGTHAIEFPCNFSGTKIERASWDHPLQLDLSGARGIRFEVNCPDMSPVSYFSVYLQSGAGWYHEAWYPEVENTWHPVEIDFSKMSPEGEPSGWNTLRTIRISAWRGLDKDTRFLIRNLRPIGQLGLDTTVAVLRGDAGAARWPDQAASITQAAQRMAADLRAAGIECALLSDTNIAAGQLEKADLLVLPHNPHLDEASSAALAGAIRKGAKVLAFYSMPASLRSDLNLGPLKNFKPSEPGKFSAIQFLPGALEQAPQKVFQNSWMINAVELQPGTSRKLADWLDADGKPSGYAAVVGTTNCIFMTHVLRVEVPAQRRQLLLAMAGSLVPELWRKNVENHLREMVRIGNFHEFSPLTNYIAREAAGNSAAMNTLIAGVSHRQMAEQLLAAKQYSMAISEASAAAENLERAFCLAQSPQWPEFRGFWCHSAFGVKGMSWDEAISRLAENGFTAIVPNMLWGGAAFYDSKFLPQPASLAATGDQVKECLEACRKHGIEMHVWKVNYYLGSHAPKDFVEKMRSANRLQVSFEGEPHDWLCPSHPQNQKLEIDSMVELARNYAIDGIHFDYIRYPGQDYCFCAGCKSRFEEAAGLTIANWPRDVRTDPGLKEKWNAWRRENITTVVKSVSRQARAARPSVKISAAVFRLWDSDRDSVAQDWKIWCDEGYLDFVCPMNYTPIDRSFENMLTRQLQWTGKVPCYPGLGVSASPSKFGADRAIEQILITRKHRTGGFMIFNYGPNEARDLLPLLGMGITRRTDAQQKSGSAKSGRISEEQAATIAKQEAVKRE